MRKYIALIIAFIAISACDKSVKPINYGSDQCDFCSMTIVQKTHAAQLVTDKGKQYKFDAIECMVNTLKDDSQNTFNKAKLFVVDYGDPGEIIPAESAFYLISENIPSPMGAYLSAFKNKQEAQKNKTKKGGKIYTWEELPEVLKDDIN